MPLSNVAFSALGALGQIAEVEVLDEERPRLGNQVFGAMGRDFATRDGRHVMLVAISPKQWQGLLTALDLQQAMADLERTAGVDLSQDEGLRFTHRDAINALIEKAVAQLDYATAAARFDEHEVCWGPYQSLKETVLHHPELQPDSASRTPAVPPTARRAARHSIRPARARPSSGRRRWAKTPKRCWPISWGSAAPKSAP